MNNALITVIGPTAIGKTALGVSLAQHFHTEVVSSDSRQFYREMAVGTAVPDAEEMKGIPHHFVQHISIDTPYSVGRFEREALELLQKLFAKFPQVVLVGGSGLYTRALLYGLDKFPEIKPGLRKQLDKVLREKGIRVLQNRLQTLDPEYYERVDKNNPHRLIRALEVCLSSGKPYSSFLDQPKSTRPFTPIQIGLTAKREELYARINQRVDLMMERGLLAEAQRLYPHRNRKVLQTIGYQELFAYLEGRYSLEETVGEIKKNTRRFAKRQLTWFRKMEDVHWFDFETPHREIADKIQSKLMSNT